MTLRALLIALVALLWPLAATAREQINDFTVEIEVRKSGDIFVTETIKVMAEGAQIKRGIFRDLPRYYLKNNTRYSYDYDIRRIERDGRREPYAIERDGNAMRIRIGDADVFLDQGVHEYVIEYAVRNQVRYFDRYDEIYWNATGNYWNFPIAHAQVVVRLPDGAAVTQVAAYTGGAREAGGAYRHSVRNGAQIFETTKALERRQGLTIAVGFEKGVVDPPSAADLRDEWLERNASALVLSSAIALLSIFYAWAYIRVGRDPAKGPVFARYAPPEGLSPAGVHHIYHRTLTSHDALIATILNFAVMDAIRIDAEDKKKTTLTLLGAPKTPPAPEEETFLSRAFKGRSSFTLGKGYDAAFTSAYHKFQREVARRYGKPYFRWNSGYMLLGIILTIAAIIATIALSVAWTAWHSAGVAALVVMAGAFAYFIPAPTMATGVASALPQSSSSSGSGGGGFSGGGEGGGGGGGW